MADLPPSAALDVPALGRMLQALHRASVPVGLRPLRALFAPEESCGQSLPPELRHRFSSLAGSLFVAYWGAPAILHADLSPINVLITAQGPRVIDPACYVGYRATGSGGGRAWAGWFVAQPARRVLRLARALLPRQQSRGGADDLQRACSRAPRNS